MKKMFLSAGLLLFCLQSFSQPEKSVTFSKDYYLKKGKNNSTVGWVVLGAGTAMIVGGLVAYSEAGFNSGDVAGGIAIAGILADIISIPIFISAHRYKKLAAGVALTHQKILQYQRNHFGLVRRQPSLTVSVLLR